MPLFESCFSELRVDGRRLYLKGVNWFGFETTDKTFHGLWSRPFVALLDFVSENGFNALRIPVSGELIEGFSTITPSNIDFSQNPDLEGTTAGQQLDYCIREAGKRGILVLLDLHHQAAARGITELWYDDEAGWSEERVIACLKTLCERYKCDAAKSGGAGGRSGEFWNVFAVDLNNEPHGKAAWGNGCPLTDWRLGAERLGTAVLSVDPSLLIFIEGTSGNAAPLQCPEPCFWGGGLCSAVEAPVRLPVKRRLVLSPHVYGPLVFMQSYFSDPSFPRNMPAIWEKQWAHAKTKKSENDEDAPAIVVGEFGGRFPEGSLERCWAAAFASYLRDTGLSDCFFWCLNPNSGDTGGLLKDDWSAPDPSSSSNEAFKLALLFAINPRPTKFDAAGNVIDPGGGPGYDPSATPMPAEVERALEAFSSGRGGGGGAGAAANGDGGNNNNSAPSDSSPAAAAASAQLPAPVTTSHPSGITVTAVPTKSWASGATTAFQCDVKIKNEGSSSTAPPSLVLSCAAAVVEQSWNCTRLADKDGKAVLGLPAWCVSNGGIAPGGEVRAGGVFLGEVPGFEIGFS